MKSRYWVCLHLLLSTAMLSASGLHFKKTERSVDVAADAKVLEVLFPFVNTSKKDVIVMRYDAPCTCMSAMLKGGTRLSKDGPVKFAPGQKGVFKGVFELGNFSGLVEKKIVIWTDGDAKDAPSIQLTTKVTIPKLIEATPKSLIWEVGGVADTKVITIKVAGDSPIRIVKHSCSNESLNYKFVTVREGFEYKVEVTPSTTEKVLFAALRFTTDSENQRYKFVQTFMTIKPISKK